MLACVYKEKQEENFIQQCVEYVKGPIHHIELVFISGLTVMRYFITENSIVPKYIEAQFSNIETKFNLQWYRCTNINKHQEYIIHLKCKELAMDKRIAFDEYTMFKSAFPFNHMIGEEFILNKLFGVKKKVMNDKLMLCTFSYCASLIVKTLQDALGLLIGIVPNECTPNDLIILTRDVLGGVVVGSPLAGSTNIIITDYNATG